MTASISRTMFAPQWRVPGTPFAAHSAIELISLALRCTCLTLLCSTGTEEVRAFGMEHPIRVRRVRPGNFHSRHEKIPRRTGA